MFQLSETQPQQTLFNIYKGIKEFLDPERQKISMLFIPAILKVENNNKTHLALIKGFLKVKYRLVEEVTKKSLEEAQL
ncbi:hypothetical protein CWI38_0249p0050, partial [Hamiltosporidium tvaerminnensis]